MQSVPKTLLTGKFLLTYWEKRGKEKGKMERKRRIIGKEKVENWIWKEEMLQNDKMRTQPFFFFFFFAFHFSKPLKFVLGLPKWEFSTGKKAFRARKKKQKKWLRPLWKMTLPPLKNIPLTLLPQYVAFSLT